MMPSVSSILRRWSRSSEDRARSRSRLLRIMTPPKHPSRSPSTSQKTVPRNALGRLYRGYRTVDRSRENSTGDSQCGSPTDKGAMDAAFDRPCPPNPAQKKPPNMGLEAKQELVR